MKKLVRITFAAVLGLMLSLTVSAASGTIASGTGWTLDENGTLTITEGMETEAAGWRDYAPQIQTAVLTKDAHPLPDSPFLGCTSLTAITVEEGNPTFFSDGGVLYLEHDRIPHSIMAYPAANPAKEYVLPETVKNIAPYAFADARYLERVTLHGDMEWILDCAFRNCSALTEVNVPENMAVHCSSNVFEGCTSLDPAFVEEFCWDQVFYDVNPGDGYFNAVKYVSKAGLFKGISDYDFAPDSPMTRAMFVTVLGRLAEMQDFYTDENLVWMSFEDVEDDQWYTYYVNWAATNDIVTGYGNGKFGVNDKVTVEQAAVILYRYAGLTEPPAYDMEEDYTDTEKISGWARAAMRWITAYDIYTGMDGELRPKENASRAVVAQMLYKMPPVYQR